MLGLWVSTLLFAITASIRLPIIKCRSFSIGLNSHPGLAIVTGDLDGNAAYWQELANVWHHRTTYKLVTTEIAVVMNKDYEIWIREDCRKGPEIRH